MRRLTTLALMVALLAIGAESLAAQEGTPTPAPDVMEGITIENLGEVSAETTPPGLLGLTRLTFEPGAILRDHTQPGVVLVAVASGRIGLTLVAGDVRGGVQVFRGVGATDASPGPSEQLDLGTEATLNAGDSVALDQDVTRAMRNIGDEPAVVYVSTLLAQGEPSFQFSA